MKNLLNEENLQESKQRELVLKSFQTILKSYKTHYAYISDTSAWARIKFKGNTRCEIYPDKIILSGFGLVNAPDAKLSPVSSCGDEGTVTLDSLAEFANTLAKYERILPLN